jgi:hypothetical protein
MSLFPVPRDDDSGGFSARQLERASRDEASSSLEVFRYGLAARAAAQMDQIDSEAVADVSRVAFDEECDLLDRGLARVGQSATKAVLLARHVERLANINDRRITRRFGG